MATSVRDSLVSFFFFVAIALLYSLQMIHSYARFHTLSSALVLVPAIRRDCLLNER